MASYLKEYLEEIRKRFIDLETIRGCCFTLLENPWHDDLKFCQFGFNNAQLINEIRELKHDTQLIAEFIEHSEKKECVQFWRCVPNTHKSLRDCAQFILTLEKKECVQFWRCVPNTHKSLRDCAQFILTLFPSTYLCAASFSKMNFLRSKYRNRLSSHLEDTMRIACSPKDANIDEVANKVHHKPHSLNNQTFLFS
ncbi:hypothetical protein QE152_g6580 [Popillia japonica]|uniref:HAT C-terminal dimerisation domain-containing protein n=1 Tax=Popillia japonica TaxID=7064 RepID=A0AAW1MHR6_POPJA